MSLSQYKEQSGISGEWIKNEEQYQVARTFQSERIGSLSREDISALIDVMGKWRVLLGATSESSEEELIVIVQFVYDNFKRLTVEDIILAMNWSISGKIDIGFVSQKMLSSFYVSKALNAYMNYKRQVVTEIIEEKQRYIRALELQEDERNKPTPEQKAQIFKEHIVAIYESHKKNIAWFDFGDFVYEWLKSTNQINRDPAIIQLAIKYGEDKYLQDKRNQSLKNSLQEALSNINSGNKEQQKKKYARQYVIMQYFDTYSLAEIVSRIKPEQFVEK